MNKAEKEVADHVVLNISVVSRLHSIHILALLPELGNALL